MRTYLQDQNAYDSTNKENPDIFLNPAYITYINNILDSTTFRTLSNACIYLLEPAYNYILVNIRKLIDDNINYYYYVNLGFVIVYTLLTLCIYFFAWLPFEHKLNIAMDLYAGRCILCGISYTASNTVLPEGVQRWLQNKAG